MREGINVKYNLDHGEAFKAMAQLKSFAHLDLYQIHQILEKQGKSYHGWDSNGYNSIHFYQLSDLVYEASRIFGRRCAVCERIDFPHRSKYDVLSGYGYWHLLLDLAREFVGTHLTVICDFCALALKKHDNKMEHLRREDVLDSWLLKRLERQITISRSSEKRI